MLIGINSSEAAEITSLPASVPDDWGDGANVAIHLAADEGIECIDWSVNGTDETTTMHNGATSVDVHFLLTGHIKGEKYNIEAEVWFWDGDNCVSDTDSHSFRVYKPDVDDGWSHGVYGSATLYSITYDGSSIGISGYISGWNPTNQKRNANGKFRVTVWKNGAQVGQPAEETPPAKELDQGDSYWASGSPSKHIGEIGGNDTYSANGYVRIFVGVPTWVAEESASFDVNDNPGN